jgi:integrase
MKNFMMVQVGRYRRLFDSDGMPVDLFNRFVVEMDVTRLSDSTQTGYSEHVAGMLDYLCELGLLDPSNPPSPTNAQRLVSLYPQFLEDATLSSDPLLAQVARNLGRKPISKAACSKHCAAINKFAQTALTIIRQELDLMQARGIEETPAQLAPFYRPQQTRSRFETLRLQQNSVVAACISGTKLKATKRRPFVSTKVGERTFAGKDFPRSRLVSAINRANNSRDHLLWLMLAATGLRFSEAMQMRLSDIDLKSRSMKVHDPDGARNPITNAEQQLPNKGRRTTGIYILAPLKDMLFDALDAYLKERPQVIDQDYLFLHDTPEKYGEPLCTSTPFKTLNGTCNRAFKKAQLNSLPDTFERQPHLFTLHSLRHFYAMWLKNCVRAKGSLKLGLEMYRVQRLMGHKYISTTMRYCHDDENIVDIIMEVADLKMAGEIDEVDLDAIYGTALVEYGTALKSAAVRRLSIA